MAAQSHRALRFILGLLSLVTGAFGLVLILGTRELFLRFPFSPPEAELSTLFLAALKEVGGIFILLSFLAYAAFRDPERNAAIINGFAAGLCVLGASSVAALFTTDITRLYPASFIWGRAVSRLVVAGILFTLRPRESGLKAN